MSNPPSPPAGLVADIGGTHARFALIGADGNIHDEQVLKCADFATASLAAQAYAGTLGLTDMPSRAAVCAAGPIERGQVRMTNHAWIIDSATLERDLGFERVIVVNDFQAVALAVPDLLPDDVATVRTGTAIAGAPALVMGPGTGLGVSALIPAESGRIALASEGGHATLAPRTGVESDIAAALAARFAHVSWERVLSGPGLENLHRALHGSERTAAEITSRAQAGNPRAKATMAAFFDFLGTAASDLALAYGAQGGVFLAGGILPRVTEALIASGFAARFVDKGRFQEYLAEIPVHLITHPYPAFVGLRHLVTSK